MTYSVVKNEQPIEIEAYNQQVFFEVLSKLPAGEYTISIKGGARRPVRRRYKPVTIKLTPKMYHILEATAIVLSLCSFIMLFALVVVLGQ